MPAHLRGGGPATAPPDTGIEDLLAEFQSAPSISLGDFPPLDEEWRRPSGESAQSPMAYQPFKHELRPQDSAYVLTPLVPSSAFGGSGGKSSSGTHHSGELSDGDEDGGGKGHVGKRSRGGSARAARTADKNRQAQKRYRERQKEKMADFERQVEELSGRVSLLMEEKRTLESRNSLLERVVQLNQESVEDEKEPATVQQKALFRSFALLSSLLKPLPCSTEEASRFTTEDIIEVYGGYVAALNECMLGPVEDVLSPTYMRLRQLIDAHREVLLHMGQTDVKMVSKIHCTLKRNAAPPGLCVSVLEKMALSDEQRRRILDARQTLLHSMDAIVQRRREIIASLQGLLPDTMPLVPEAQTTHVRSLHCALKASDELRDSLEAEHHAVGEFIAAFYAPDLLTPVQEARMVIASAPYKVDTLALANQVAADAGPPPADCLMSELSGLLDEPQAAGPLCLMPASSAFRNLSKSEAADRGLPALSLPPCPVPPSCFTSAAD